VRIILEQQVSLASARAVYSRLRREAGAITPRSIAALGVEGLRGSGLTRQKASYCHELAVLIDRHELDLGRIAGGPDGVAREALLRVRGLGPWSVDIYFLMALRRPDVWPHGDLALAEAAFRVKRLPRRPAPDELSRLAAQWSPWRSVAARILWHFYLSERAARASDGRPHA
jgi:DNA-3-methyladenine glycosylase II